MSNIQTDPTKPPPEPTPPAAPPSPLPWLILPSKLASATFRTFYLLSSGTCRSLHLPDLVGKRIYAVSDGWLLAGDESSGDRFLYNPTTQSHKPLPRWDQPNATAHHVALIASPEAVVAVVLANRVAFCRPGDPRWSVQRSPTGPESDNNSANDFVAHNGKFYFLKSRKRIVVVDLPGGTTKQVDMNVKTLPPTEAYRRHYLVSCGGELMMILVTEEVSSLKVFKADLAGKVWVLVENLGSNILFLGRGCSVALHGDCGGWVYVCCPAAVAEEERRRGRERWLWSVFVVGIGSPAVKYVPPIRMDGFSLEECCWFVPNP